MSVIAEAPSKRRILVVDDTENVRNDFALILQPDNQPVADLGHLSHLSGVAPSAASQWAELPTFAFDVDFATNADEAFYKVNKAQQEQNPYCLVFMDVRMPPGLDGIQVIKSLMGVHTNMEFVICTAFSDYSTENMLIELGVSDRVLLLQKPFEPMVIKQVAISQTTKYLWRKEIQEAKHFLEQKVVSGDKELAIADAQLKNSLVMIDQMKDTMIRKEKLSSLGVLSAGLAHEIKNPLTCIVMANQFIQATINNNNLEINKKFEKIHSHSQMITTHAQRIDNIIKSFLLVSSDDPHPKEVCFYLESLINDIKNYYNSNMLKINGTFELQGLKEIRLKCNQNVLGIALSNFISNSISAMEDKHDEDESFIPEIKIFVKDDRLYIRDNGGGIPESIMNRIFDPFYSTKPVGKGTGLGLFIAHNLLTDFLGESVEIENKGDGLQVSVTLRHIWEPKKAA